jgi:lipoprotein-releasing system ATP-binding protein
MPAILAAEHLTRRLHGDVEVTLVDDVSLAIGLGEFVAVTGPSGSGKSSLLYLLGLLDKPTGGRLLLNGVDTARLGDDRLAALRLAEIGFVFQFHFLLPEFTVFENVMLPMQRLGRLSRAAMAARTSGLLADLGLLEHAGKLPKQLSGGQSQRVAIARALANEPLLVLADEPTGNLDSIASQNVRTIIRALAHQRDTAVVVVTHDQGFAGDADRIVTMVDGRIDGDLQTRAGSGPARVALPGAVAG